MGQQQGSSSHSDHANPSAAPAADGKSDPDSNPAPPPQRSRVDRLFRRAPSGSGIGGRSKAKDVSKNPARLDVAGSAGGGSSGGSSFSDKAENQRIRVSEGLGVEGVDVSFEEDQGTPSPNATFESAGSGRVDERFPEFLCGGQPSHDEAEKESKDASKNLSNHAQVSLSNSLAATSFSNGIVADLSSSPQITPPLLSDSSRNHRPQPSEMHGFPPPGISLPTGATASSDFLSDGAEIVGGGGEGGGARRRGSTPGGEEGDARSEQGSSPESSAYQSAVEGEGSRTELNPPSKGFCRCPLDFI